MVFYTCLNQPRPVRLSEATRQFAWDSLHHQYGLDTLKTMSVPLDDVPNIHEMSELEKYDAAIYEIATKAPIRICEGELLSGAATLGQAIYHQVPASINGEAVCASISHLTIGFEPVIREGIDAIEKRARESLARHPGAREQAFLKSALHCIDCMRIWHQRYLEALKADGRYQKNVENLMRVPFRPAANFHEAVQSLWFTFAFVRLCGNWPGIGRLDEMLGDFLKRDLAEGRLTLNEAREILAHFFIKGCEWICGAGHLGISGDAQHYQNIVLAGMDQNGAEVTNEVTYLVLDILEELGISDFPTSVRICANSSEKLLTRVAEVIRHGGGIVALYNEDTVLKALTGAGYPLSEARRFANDGCWEVQVPGKTNFAYIPFDGLRVLQAVTLKNYEEAAFPDFDSLYRQYTVDLKEQIDAIFNDVTERFIKEGDDPTAWDWKPSTPCTIPSLFEEGCIEKGRSYVEGGPVYHTISPHIGGLPDVVNALYAIKKLVFEERKVSFSNLMRILRSNWEGEEALRQYVRNKYRYFGNDNPEVDAIAAALLNDFADFVISLNGRSPIHFVAGVSTFGREIAWGKSRLAVPHGYRKGDTLAPNLSPTPGSDHEGATAIIKSHCRADLSKLACGLALDLKLFPTCVQGEAGIAGLTGLMRGFVNLNGFFVQIDVLDNAVLKAAQEHPEDYQTLSVRVSGWNARFVTLSREWQDMLIARTAQTFES